MLIEFSILFQGEIFAAKVFFLAASIKTTETKWKPAEII